MSDMNLNSPAEGAAASTPSWQEALSATVSEAVAGSSDGAEVSDEAADSADGIEEADAADKAAGASDADPDEVAADGAEAQPDGAQKAFTWDGKPDSLPPEIMAIVEAAKTEAVKKRESEMSRGVQKILQEKAAMEQQLQAIYAHQQQAQAAPQQQAGPPKPPADSAGPEEWDKYYDQKSAWTTKQTIAEMIQTGALLTPEMVRPIQEQSQEAAIQTRQVALLQHAARLPGCTDEIMAKMAELGTKDKKLHSLMWEFDGIETVFNIAKAQSEYEAKLAGVGVKAEDDARRGAAAGKQAMSRPGGVRKEGERVGRPKESFRSVAERVEYEIAQARKA
jgi:hypothetical protein